MKIVITGGHHNSALAVIDELNKLGKYQYLWFGHKHSVWGDKNDSVEYKEVTERGIPFVNLKAGKLYKTFNPAKLIRLPRGFINAFYHLVKFKPKVVLSFGGYLAAPVALAAFLLRIPVFTHEQTSVSGWSNRFIGKLARKIFVTWPSSVKYFSKEKVTVTGLPLRKEILGIREKMPEASSPASPAGRRQPTCLYVTGGKQGSHTINEVIKEALPQLLKEFKVTHQCGSVSFLNSKKILQKAVSKFPKDLQEKYFVQEYFFSKDLANVLEKADVIICRGGAHTIYELAYLGKLCIIIPIPWASHNEQFKNAQILEKAGSSIILPQKDISASKIHKACKDLKNNYKKYHKNATAFSKLIKKDAAYQIAFQVSKI